MILLLMTGSVVAQEDQANPNPRKSPFGVLARFLELTEDQIEATKQILVDRQEALKPLREELAGLNQQWKEEMSSDEPNPTTLGEIALDRRAFGMEIAEIKKVAKEGFLALLVGDQLPRLRALRRAERLQPIVKITKGLNLY
jgi:hypothetical protein